MTHAYACWTAANASYVIATEALEGDDAVFLATHTPMTGFEVEGTGRAEISSPDEQSLLDAMSCGATIVASDTAPVREMIRHGENGILFDFFNVDALAEYVSQLIDRREEYRILGQQASLQIHEHYSVDVCLPKMVKLYEQTVQENVVT